MGRLARLFELLFRRHKPETEETPPELTESGEKYFSLMLGDFFSTLGNRGSDKRIDDSEGNPVELESSPLLDLLKEKPEQAKDSGTHEDHNGQQQSVHHSSDKGESLSPTPGEGAGGFAAKDETSTAKLDGHSSDARGRDDPHSRISASINSVVSEGAVPGHVIFDEIGQAKEIFDWRRILRPNGSFDVDWSYKNAVIEDGIVRPVLEAVPVAVTEILLDTSGSINEPLLRRFLQECKNIMPYSKVRVGCFDTRFYGFHDIHTPDELDKMIFEGRHGTSFSAAVNAFSGRADNRVIFTDGDAPMPAKRMDVIWIVFGGKRIKPMGGRIFYVDEDFS